MIAEEKKELVDRRKFYYLITQRMNEKSNGATLNSSMNLGEILEIFWQLPAEDEQSADWISKNGKWECSWCLMSALEKMGESYPSKRCPYCGRRMKVRI